MNRIPPAALTNEISKSAAAQMAEHDYTEKIKNCGGHLDITACVPKKIAEKAIRDIPAGAVFVGVDLSSASDMTDYIDIKRVLQNENN